MLSDDHLSIAHLLGFSFGVLQLIVGLSHWLLLIHHDVTRGCCFVYIFSSFLERKFNDDVAPMKAGTRLAALQPFRALDRTIIGALAAWLAAVVCSGGLEYSPRYLSRHRCVSQGHACLDYYAASSIWEKDGAIQEKEVTFLKTPEGATYSPSFYFGIFPANCICWMTHAALFTRMMTRPPRSDWTHDRNTYRLTIFVRLDEKEDSGCRPSTVVFFLSIWAK